MSEPRANSIEIKVLREFCEEILEKRNVSKQDAEVTVDVLISADLRGIHSHGVARLRRYVDGLENGMMKADAQAQILREHVCTAALDAGAGLGQPVSKQAMTMAIAKAKEAGMGFVTVRNSNHYGIAGYYSMMALEHGLIGYSSTNADILVVPTFGKNAMLGTNPISVAVPAGREKPFVLDMATSVVPRGKLEVYKRQEKILPLGWATDEKGVPTQVAGRVLDNLKKKAGGGLLPLGGAGELLGGHKGYGFSLLVDILTGVLSGSAYADTVYPKDAVGKSLPANLGHVFAAIDIERFRPLAEFKSDMDDLIKRLKSSKKAEGEERIYIHGEKEFEKVEQQRKSGIMLNPKVVDDLRALGEESGVDCLF